LHNSFTHTAKEIVGRRIKFLRESKRMTQQELADLLKADRQYVWKLEAGKKNITLDYLDSIAKALQVSQSDFLKTNL